MVYELKFMYSDSDGTHSIVETWTGKSKEDMFKHVIEYLDILHKDGVPYEPTIENVEECFSQFGIVDKDSITKEYNRLNSGWKAWNELVEEIEKYEKLDYTLYDIFIKVDENTRFYAMLELEAQDPPVAGMGIHSEFV